jgi:hypothetical protein
MLSQMHERILFVNAYPIDFHFYWKRRAIDRTNPRAAELHIEKEIIFSFKKPNPLIGYILDRVWEIL